MNYMRTISITLFLSVSAFASTTKLPPSGFTIDTQAVIQEAKLITPEKYPNSDEILVDDHVLEEYSKDGTSIYWDDEYTKILTEKGRRNNMSHSFHFTTSYSTSYVCKAEIIKPDGTIVPIDIDKYTKVMTEQSQMGSNIYNPRNKVMTLSTPGVEIGDICHIVYCRITHKARMSNTWSDRSLFEYTSPIAKLDYEIISPAGLPIKHKLIRSPISDTVVYIEKKLPGGRTSHLWKVRDVARLFQEPDMPPLSTQAQRLLLSTIQDWETVSKWYWDLCKEPMDAITPEMKAKVQELTEEAKSRDEKIRRIFKFVSQEVRYMGLTTEDVAPGYEPHPVDMTFDNRYGVCRDKAALLAAMLIEAGIPAYPVLIHAGAKMDQDIPVPFFNHAITAADKPGGGYILMDPTDENTKELFPAYLCNRSYLVAKEEGETLLVSDVYPAEKNMMRIESEGTLDANGSLLLKTRLNFEGINDNAYRGAFLRRKEDQRRDFFESVLKKRLPGAEVIECVIEPNDLQNTDLPLSVTLTSLIPDYPVQGDSVDLLTMPWLGTSIGYVNFVIGATGLEKRKYPMKTDITCALKEVVSIDISAGLKEAHSIPSSFDLNRAGIRFSLKHTLEDGRLTGVLSQKIETPEFSPSEYIQLKQSLRDIEAETRKRPLFASGSANPPDQEMLFHRTETELHSSSSWTTTSTWSKRILTYAGKKHNSELKYAYNPAWQHLELISATVSNLNGKVFSVSSKEINIMDAGWSASAPRYPAGKTLIANLPGVEIGSVITVQTIATRSNANFYASSTGFGGTSPSANETFELTWPRELKPAIQSFNLDGYVTCRTATNEHTVTAEWSSERPPELEAEHSTPPWHFNNPHVFVSFGDWHRYSRKLHKVIRKALKDDDAAKKQAKELLTGIKDPRDRLLAIRNYVLRNIRVAGPSYLSLPLSSVSAADRTFQDQYGNRLDRAILLAAMLDAAGLRPELLFASGNRSRYQRSFQPMLDIPQPGFFGRPLVKVTTEGQTYYLNDGNQYTELGVSGSHNAPALTLKGDVDYIEVPEHKQDRSKSSILIDLSDDGSAVITSTNWYYGTSFSHFRKSYSEMLPEKRRRHYLEIVNGVAMSATATTDLTTDYNTFPGLMTYTVKADDYAVVENKSLTLSLPMVSGPIFPARTDTRKNPLLLRSNTTSEMKCTVILPVGYSKLALVPESRRWELPEGVGSFTYDVQTKERNDRRTEVTITRTTKLKSGVLAPEMYPAILEYNRIASHPSMRTLVVEKE